MKARSAAVLILNQLNNIFYGYEETTELFLSKNHFIPEDRNFINKLVKGVIEHSKYLDFVIDKSYKGKFKNLEKIALNILRIGVFQSKILKTPDHAFVNETVNITKEIKKPRLTGLINGILRHVATDEEIEKHLSKYNKINRLAILYSFPEWMIKKWIKDFGEVETIKLLKFNNTSSTIFFRLNSLKTNKEILFNLLDKEQIQYKIITEEPSLFFTVKDPWKLLKSNIFKSGFCSVQDLSQSFPVNLLSPIDNEVILDICAAPGGKSTYIAQLTQNNAQIISYDISKRKLNLLKDEIKRLEITSIEIQEANSETFEFPEADKILVDAPCTGTGVLNRKADIRWSKHSDDIHKTNQIQKNILNNAAKSLKQGGTLVYSTCSIEIEENQKIIDNFLSNHPDFVLEPAQNYIDEKYCDSKGYVNILPHEHNIPGGFAARLTKGKK